MVLLGSAWLSLGGGLVLFGSVSFSLGGVHVGLGRRGASATRERALQVLGRGLT